MQIEILKELIRKTWAGRYAQDPERFFQSYHLLSSHISILHTAPPSPSNLLAIYQGLDEPEVFQEVVLLQVSNLRFQLRQADSIDLLHALTEFMVSRGIIPCFRYLFERGNHAMFRSDYAGALDLFIKASLLAGHDGYLLAIALTNQLLCMEELGLSSTETERRLRTIIPKLRRDGVDLIGIDRQFAARQLRKAFHSGKFEKFEKVASKQYTGHAAYLFRFYSALPYMRGKADVNAGNDLLNPDGFALASYRSRTLLGILHPDDLHPGKPSEWVDRLYLWLWMWLEKQNQDALERVMVLLREEPEGLNSLYLSQEDRQMLRNVLLWLSYFDSTSSIIVNSLLNRISSSAGDYSAILGLERLFISYITSLRKSDAALVRVYKQALMTHPLYHQANTLFPSLVAYLNNEPNVNLGPLVLLGKTLGRHIELNSNNKQARYYIDPSAYLILDTKSNKEIISESLTKAICLLANQRASSNNEFVEHCFGITQYDSCIHLPKIYHLLRRLKNLFGPEIRFGVKTGVVYAKGCWKHVGFIQEAKEFNNPNHYQEWRNFLQRRSYFGLGGRVTHSSLPAREVHRVLRRLDLEQLIGRSRATTNRMIAQWEKDGLVLRIGNSRNTKYQLSENLKTQLQQGESTI